MELTMNNSMTAPLLVCGEVIEPARIASAALRGMIERLAAGDRAMLVSSRHKDWNQQGQCGCLTGCMGG